MRPVYGGFGPGKPNPIVLGRKFCAYCGRWRPIHDFGMQPHRRLDSWCLGCRREQRKLAWRRRSAEQVALRQEYQRMYREAMRRKRGASVRIFRKPRPLRAERVFFPIEPLLSLLNDAVATETFASWETLARRAGLDGHTIRRLRFGESAHVRIDTADKLAQAIGLPLALIYPDEYRGDSHAL